MEVWKGKKRHGKEKVEEERHMGKTRRKKKGGRNVIMAIKSENYHVGN